MTRLSIIIPSSGRPTLQRAIESTHSQMRDGDELLVSIQTDCPWGHRARNQIMPAARGDALVFLDDDDVHVPGALDIIRKGFEQAPDRAHLFRMRYANGYELWRDPILRCGNVSTGMMVVPNCDKLGVWSDRYEGDFDFFEGTCMRLGDPVFHEELITLVRPP